MTFTQRLAALRIFRACAALCLSAALLACTDTMPAMAYFDGRSGAFDKRIALDWTIIGGPKARLDRLLVVDDGHARRNKRGNLFTRASLTKGELAELAQLTSRWGRIDVEWHSAAAVSPEQVQHERARRLRFDGHGSPGGEAEVTEFAERVLHRLSPASLVRNAAAIVETEVASRRSDGSATLMVLRAAAGTELGAGDIVRVELPEAREGAGGKPTVFALAKLRRDGDGWTAALCAYIKVAFDEAARLRAVEPTP